MMMMMMTTEPSSPPPPDHLSHPRSLPLPRLRRCLVLGGWLLAAVPAALAQSAPPVTTGLVLRLESDTGVAAQSTGIVTRWNDLTSLRNDLFAHGDPTLKAAATPSGRPAVSFDGHGDKLERVASSHAINGLPTGNANRSVFLVARYHRNTAWSGFTYGSGKANAAFGLIAKPTSGELAVQGWGHGNDHVSSAAAIGAGWQLHSTVLQDGALNLFRNGLSVLSRRHTFATTRDKIALGQEISHLGSSTMDVAAALIYNRALNATERASVESYLRQKYLLATTTNTAPHLTIQSPADGASSTVGTSVRFTGTATDLEDGTLSASIEWRSNVDGFLGRNASVSTSRLSTGSHVITATVTDSRGAKVQSRVTHHVNALVAAPAPEPAPAPPAPTSTIKLFNGTNLNGLYVWSQKYGRSDPTGVFRVSNGQIRVASDLPYAVLVTEKEYDNYIMVLEFKWGTQTYGERTGKARDAGILLHSHGHDGSWRGRHMAGIEVQVIEGGMGDLMLLKGRDLAGNWLPIRMNVACTTGTCVNRTWYCRGEHRWSASAPRRTFTSDLDTVHWYGWDAGWADVAGYRGRVNLEKANGEWNQFIVVADGDRIETYFNGVKVNEAFNVIPSRGKIQLQSEQAEYYIRRWELQPLP
jgi:hypothetical protein